MNVCRMIDKQKAESEQHRAAVRRRRAAAVNADDEDIDGIVGVYASHNEVYDVTVIATPININFKLKFNVTRGTVSQ